MNGEQVCLVTLFPQINMLYWTVVLAQDLGHDYTAMGSARYCILKCHVNVDRVIPVVLCVASVTDSPVPMACALAARPVSYPHLPARQTKLQLTWL